MGGEEWAVLSWSVYCGAIIVSLCSGLYFVVLIEVFFHAARGDSRDAHPQLRLVRGVQDHVFGTAQALSGERLGNDHVIRGNTHTGTRTRNITHRARKRNSSCSRSWCMKEEEEEEVRRSQKVLGFESEGYPRQSKVERSLFASYLLSPSNQLNHTECAKPPRSAIWNSKFLHPLTPSICLFSSFLWQPFLHRFILSICLFPSFLWQTFLHRFIPSI
jgi:hypothetical protein